MRQFQKGLSLLPWHKQAIIRGHMTQFWRHLTRITWPLGYAKCLLACFWLPMKLQDVCKSSLVLSGFLQFYGFFSVFCSTWPTRRFTEKPLQSSSSTCNKNQKHHIIRNHPQSSFKVVSYSTSLAPLSLLPMFYGSLFKSCGGQRLNSWSSEVGWWWVMWRVKHLCTTFYLDTGLFFVGPFKKTKQQESTTIRCIIDVWRIVACKMITQRSIKSRKHNKPIASMYVYTYHIN